MLVLLTRTPGRLVKLSEARTGDAELATQSTPKGAHQCGDDPRGERSTGFLMSPTQRRDSRGAQKLNAQFSANMGDGQRPHLVLAVKTGNIKQTINFTLRSHQDSHTFTGSPHVQVIWGGKVTINVLLDTGADFSLVSANHLKQTTLVQLQAVMVSNC